MSHVWLVLGVTESGDNWQMVFDYEPESIDIEEEIKKDSWLREEHEASCISGYKVIRMNVIQD